MKNASVLRLTGDLCLYFGALSIFKVFQIFTPLMGLFILLAAAGLSAAVRLKNRVLQVLPVLLPALIFLKVNTLAGAVIFGLPLLYLLLTAALNRFTLSHWEYYRIFRVTMWAGVAVAFIGSIQGTLWTVAFGALFVLFGVIALRNLRMGMEMSLKWRGMNLAGIVLPFGLALLLGRLFYAVLKGVKNIFTVLALPEIAAILFVQDALGWFTGYLYDKVDEAASRAEETVATTEMATKALEDVTGNDTSLPRWMENIHIDRLIVLLVFLTIIVGVLIYLMVRRHRAEEEKADIVYEEGERASVRRRKRRRQEKNPTNAERVRRVYREYMELLTHYGVSREKDTTSEDLLRSSGDLFTPEPNCGLRNIYLKARYGRGEDVTSSDADAAETCLGELRKSLSE